MNLPPLYKYLDLSGARLTLGNKTFKHAKPSDFNDVNDLTVQSIFPEDTEEALKKIAREFPDVIVSHLNEEPTCGYPMNEKISVIQQIYRTNPEAIKLVRRELANTDNYDIEYYRSMAQSFLAEINEFMQDYRVLCVSTHKHSERMWSEYAENHKGIVLRIEPYLEKASKFQLFRPVEYREKRPPLFEDAIGFVEGALFGDQEARISETIDRIIYSKTLDWQHEGEYRLAIPMLKDEEPWTTIPYHSEEITELYLGCRMNHTDVEDIVNLARRVNSRIVVFQASRSGSGSLEFELL